MAYFPDVRSFDKLINNDWRKLVYGEKSDKWYEKIYSLVNDTWKQISPYLESRARQFVNYWPVYATFLVGAFIVVVVYKTLNHVGTIKLTKNHKSERRRVEQQIYSEESRIISDNVDYEETASFIQKPCPTSGSDLESSTNAGDNDHTDSLQESSEASEITVVATERNERGDLLRNFIESIEEGDDTLNKKIASIEKVGKETENDKGIEDLQESTREKVNSENCKHFYVLTPWLGPPENTSETPSIPTTNSLQPPTLHEASEKFTTNRLDIKEIELDKNAFVDSKPEKPDTSKVATVDCITDEQKSPGTQETANSTLATPHESSSVCYPDEVLSILSNSGENIFSTAYSSPNPDRQAQPLIVPKTDHQHNNLEEVFGQFLQGLPELDLSPITPTQHKIQKPQLINVMKSDVRTNAKQRSRSHSQDNRTASSSKYFNTRRGGSMSPTSRNKNKIGFTKESQSKIPTLSPLGKRSKNTQDTDGSVAEAADQIRSVLLRKLKEVWEQHPRSTSPNRSNNSSLETSTYYTPEGVSRIPLPRRSPQRSNANNPISSSHVINHSARETNQPEQFSSGTYKNIFSDDVSDIPLHSTPKSSRNGNPRK